MIMFINARKKESIFCRTESVAMTPKSCDHMPTTSLWGVAVKWLTRAPKTKLILYPRDPQGYSHISLRPVRQDFERVPEHRVGFEANPTAVFHGVCKIALSQVLATQMGVMRRSKKVSSFELYQLNPLNLRVDCAGARALLYLGSSAIVTVRGNTVGRHS